MTGLEDSKFVLIPKESNKFLAVEIDQLQAEIFSDLGQEHLMMDILLNNAINFNEKAEARYSFHPNDMIQKYTDLKKDLIS